MVRWLLGANANQMLREPGTGQKNRYNNWKQSAVYDLWKKIFAAEKYNFNHGFLKVF